MVKILISGEKTITVVHGHGSAYYTPLEQYGGDTGHTDPRSDVYSFGATLHHLLTNKAPKEARERFLDPLGELPIREYNAEISPRTERAINLAMNVHPDERIQSVAEFREYLLGDWDPRKKPKAALPTPKVNDLFRSGGERILVWIAAGLLILSIVLTALQ